MLQVAFVDAGNGEAASAHSLFADEVCIDALPVLEPQLVGY